MIAHSIAQSIQRGSWIRRMFEEGDRLKAIYGKDKVYDFTLGNPFGEPPSKFTSKLSFLATHPSSGMHRYMPNQGLEETREAIASYWSKELGLDLTSSMVIVTCGAAGGLNAVLKTLLDRGDEIIVIAPYFVEYLFYVENHGGVPKVVNSRDDFSLDLEGIAKAINPRTKGIIINSPNNPTGVIYHEEEIRELALLLEKKSHDLNSIIYLISDEPYRRIVFDDTIIPNVFQHYPESIMVYSHSKDLSIPGERIGYILVSPRCQYLSELVEGLAFSQRILGFVNAPALMQWVIKDLQGISIDPLVYQNKRDILYKNLIDMGYRLMMPKGAFYLFPESPGVSNDLDFVLAAQKKNLLLVPGRGFGKEGHFRIAYCVEDKVIRDSIPIFLELAKKFAIS